MTKKTTEWFEDWFDDLYLQLYSHRDKNEAKEFLFLLQKVYPDKLNGMKLDLACGAGRHSFLLKEMFRGDVISLDLSSALLTTAKKHMNKSDNPMFVQGDIRCLPFRDSSFDLILNMFTSFGYFSEEELLVGTLQEMNRTTRKNGLIVLDLMNKTQILRNLVEHDTVNKGDYHISQRRTYDDRLSIINKKIIIYENGLKVREITESVRIFDQDEIGKLLHQGDLSILNVFGDYNDTVYDKENSKRMIVISGK